MIMFNDLVNLNKVPNYLNNFGPYARFSVVPLPY